MRPHARRLLPLLAMSAQSCRPSDQGPAIPPPATMVVRDAGSAISVALRPAGGCPATTGRSRWGRGTVHGSTIAASERWSREGSPHRVPFGAHLLAGASLTVAPCAVVLVGAGRDLVVQGDARLRAEGTEAEPVLFGSASDAPAAGDWMGFEIRAQALPGTRFAHTIIEHAGAEPEERGQPSAAIRSMQRAGLELDHVVVRETSGVGVALLDDAGFSGASRALTITHTRGPGAVFFADADQVRTLPEGEYTGNDADEILVAGRNRTIKTDGTWRHPGAGVRYRVRHAARIMVQGVDAPRLVIAPGTTVAFEEDAEFSVGLESPGAIVADGGDPAHRVVFTSATASVEPASWVGVVLGPHTDASRSRLRFMVIEGAGARAMEPFVSCPFEGSARAEFSGMVYLQDVFANNLLTTTEFRRGPRDGVAIFVSGESSVETADFTEPSRGNIFAFAGVRCEQNERPRNGHCPATWRCHTGNPVTDTAARRPANTRPPSNGFGDASQH